MRVPTSLRSAAKSPVSGETISASVVKVTRPTWCGIPPVTTSLPMISNRESAAFLASSILSVPPLPEESPILPDTSMTMAVSLPAEVGILPSTLSALRTAASAFRIL